MRQTSNHLTSKALPSHVAETIDGV